MKRPSRPRQAVTLIELVIAMVLISVVIITAFSIYAYTVTFSIKVDNYAAATEFLCQTLETLYNYSYNDPNLSAGDHTADLPACNLRDKYGGTRQYTVGAETPWDSPNWPDPYKYITATINWNDGANRALSLSMRRNKS